MDNYFYIPRLIGIYSIFHFFYIQNKGYSERANYQKLISVVAIVTICVLIFGFFAVSSSTP